MKNSRNLLPKFFYVQYFYTFQVKVWFQNRRMKWRHNKESFSVSNTEDGLCSPIEQQYTETEVEDVDCLDDGPITPTSHIILHKEASNTARFTTF